MGAPEYYLQSLLPTSCNLWLGVSFGQHLCMADLKSELATGELKGFLKSALLNPEIAVYLKGITKGAFYWYCY